MPYSQTDGHATEFLHFPPKCRVNGALGLHLQFNVQDQHCKINWCSPNSMRMYITPLIIFELWKIHLQKYTKQVCATCLVAKASGMYIDFLKIKTIQLEVLNISQTLNTKPWSAGENIGKGSFEDSSPGYHKYHHAFISFWKEKDPADLKKCDIQLLSTLLHLHLSCVRTHTPLIRCDEHWPTLLTMFFFKSQ